MAKPKITLFFDIVSPFAYLAFAILEKSPAFKNCEIEYVPIFLGGLMKMCGNTPPIAIKNKATWINTERIRWSKQFNIPISATSPPNFPINTLPIQRALVSLSQSHPHLMVPAIQSFWENFWVEFREPQLPENITNILMCVLEKEGGDEGNGVNGGDEMDVAEEIVARSTEKEVKEGLNGNTKRAFDEGAFGLPWFSATNAEGKTEGFWGIDHLGQMCDFLGIERSGDNKGWRALL